MSAAAGQPPDYAWDPLPPSRFSPVDQMCCCYDHPAEPASIYLEARLPGHLDAAALRLAAGRALAAEPRARARRAAGSPLRRGYTWQFPRHPDTDPVSVAGWADEADLAGLRLAFLASAPSLDRCPPVRLLLAAGQTRDCLLLSAHHAALDGQSCLDLLDRIAALYPAARQRAVSPAEPAVPCAGHQPSSATPATAGSTAARPEPPRLARPARSGRLVQAGRLVRELVRRPARIAADLDGARQAGSTPDRGRPGYGLQLLTIGPVPVPPRHPGQDQATVNDLLIAALILAVGRWNAEHGRPRRPVRVSMPLGGRPDVRTAAFADPAAAPPGAPVLAHSSGNLGRTCTVAACPAPEPGDQGQLIAEVARQTARAKAQPGAQLGGFSRGLAAARLPAGVKRRLVRATLRTAGLLLCDTTMLSNLGNVASPPRFGLDGALAGPGDSPGDGPGDDRFALAFSPPAHMPRGLSVGAITADGRLELAFRYRYALFGDAAAARFAAGYRAALTELTGAAGAAGAARAAGDAGATPEPRSLSGHGQRRDRGTGA